ncbi:hypothetical protein CDAR_122511 [Caerostris darwini]|uniref:Uncharacterized protein n=1 Tax=Caerostris darwini TaxID=1538125 RepID=A0AAV4M8V6_9ARAC|nr:hypothetical protein CDAR_122511 [Caerostris darwini]
MNLGIVAGTAVFLFPSTNFHEAFFRGVQDPRICGPGPSLASHAQNSSNPLKNRSFSPWSHFRSSAGSSCDFHSTSEDFLKRTTKNKTQNGGTVLSLFFILFHSLLLHHPCGNRKDHSRKINSIFDSNFKKKVGFCLSSERRSLL